MAASDQLYSDLLTILDRRFQEIDIHSFQQLIDNSNDSNIRRKIELILNEYEYEKQTSFNVPSNLSVEQMKELLELPQIWERKKYLAFLRRNEFRRTKDKVNKTTERKANNEGTKGLFGPDGRLVYGLYNHSITQRISEVAVRRLHRHLLRTTALFGPKLVIDLDFDKYMKVYENRLLLKQLAFLYNYNRYEAKHPFDLHFVNCNADELTIKEMARYMPKVNRSDFFVSMHYNKSYLDVFPKERLVYLSPHSEQVLTSVSEDDIYIIGGIIDKSYREPITAIKAREDGIRSARLPIERYLKWLRGSKNLCINQVIAILHDWKENKDWEKTLRTYIPNRKLMTDQELLILSLKNNESKYV